MTQQYQMPGAWNRLQLEATWPHQASPIELSTRSPLHGSEMHDAIWVEVKATCTITLEALSD